MPSSQRIVAWCSEDLPIYVLILDEVVKQRCGKNLFFATEVKVAIRTMPVKTAEALQHAARLTQETPSGSSSTLSASPRVQPRGLVESRSRLHRQSNHP